MITAYGKLNGQDVEAEVINPNGWFGKTWLVEMGGSYCPRFVVIEADNASDAIDELAESKYGHEIILSASDLEDYPEDCRHYGPNGEVMDLDHIMIYGQKLPWNCVYKGDNLPADGISPLLLDTIEENDNDCDCTIDD